MLPDDCKPIQVFCMQCEKFEIECALVSFDDVGSDHVVSYLIRKMKRAEKFLFARDKTC